MREMQIFREWLPKTKGNISPRTSVRETRREECASEHSTSSGVLFTQQPSQSQRHEGPGLLETGAVQTISKNHAEDGFSPPPRWYFVA